MKGERPRLECTQAERGMGQSGEEGTDLANDLAQQEEIQLAENKQNRSQDVIPHRADFIQHPKHDVGHDHQIENCGATDRDDRRMSHCMESTLKA